MKDTNLKLAINIEFRYKCSAKQRLLAEEWERSDGPCGHHFGICFFSGALKVFFLLSLPHIPLRHLLKDWLPGPENSENYVAVTLGLGQNLQKACEFWKCYAGGNSNYRYGGFLK